MTSSCPRSIVGSAGSRIKVILGETGGDYLYCFNEDDGNSKWQSIQWRVGSGGPPWDLCRQINNMRKKQRKITGVSYDTMGRWWVQGVNLDGTGGHMWGGGGCPEIESFEEVLLCSSGRTIVLRGTNVLGSVGIDPDLMKRIKRIQGMKKKISVIRLFSIYGMFPGYFISDDEGIEWKNAGDQLSKELRNRGEDPVLDVAVGNDGDWIVFRSNRFTCSSGISFELEEKISEFYRIHSNRQNMRKWEIENYEKKVVEADKIREAEARRVKKNQEKKLQEKANYHQKEKERRDYEARLKRKNDGNDRFSHIRPKRMKSTHFDEYECAEKIDMSMLQKVVQDLATDSTERRRVLDELQKAQNRVTNEDYKKLLRCHSLEQVSNKLFNRLKSLPLDDNGCVEYEVKYEHRDPSGRGRLFAVGKKVKITDAKYPRTTTLQGMQSDLRAALAGKFSHDIDIENSQVRLICSLADQLNLKEYIPTIIHYRDDRSMWLDKIGHDNNVPEGERKRLVDIILTGGRYETWLKRVGIPPNLTPSLKGFISRLTDEIGNLSDRILAHPRFKWTKAEKNRLLNDGNSKCMIRMMSRIVHFCENQVLGIIHRTFHQNDWIVRSKVFDGLVVEPGPNATLRLKDVNLIAEESCKEQGWDIRLVEKPLNGTQQATIKTILDARKVLMKRKYQTELSKYDYYNILEEGWWSQ